MSLALAGASKSLIGGVSSSAKHITSGNKGKILEVFKNDDTKKVINYCANGFSSLVSLITFLNGNFDIANSIQEKLESISEKLSKAAFSVAHVIGAIDLWQKKNFLPFLGYAIASPIALLSTGYNMWVAVGFAEGLINFAVITDQREIVDDNGEPILDKNKNPQVINGDFKSRGWWSSITTTLSESKKMLIELYKKPSRIKKMTHSLFASNLFMLIAPVFGILNLKKLEAVIRNCSTVAIESSMLFHKNITNEQSLETHQRQGSKSSEGINLRSPIAQSGLLWICAAASDLLKRFDYFSEKIKNLTHLSMLFDRVASTRFTQGILNIKE
ncbi:MAG: hypothetical protein HY094_04535 [Candidatus Melainabacteria bacterium]|nr:hypothetical protein [Candidatus Melainabacteria bacterium]